MIPISFSEDRLRDALKKTLQSGIWGTIGENSVHTAKTLATLAGTESALLCASPVAALEAVLRALCIGTGDRVVLPGVSSPHLLNAVLATGALPIFADTDPSLLVRAQSAAFHAEGACAVLVEELAGYPCEIDKIADACHQKGVPLIDCTPSPVSTRLHGRSTAVYADYAVASLPVQNIGAILCREENLEKVYAAHHCGNPLGTGAALNAGLCLGGDMRIDEWRCAILAEFLASSDTQIREQRSLFVHLREALSHAGLSPIPVTEDADSAGLFVTCRASSEAPTPSKTPFLAHTELGQHDLERVLFFACTPE